MNKDSKLIVYQDKSRRSIIYTSFYLLLSAICLVFLIYLFLVIYLRFHEFSLIYPTLIIYIFEFIIGVFLFIYLVYKSIFLIKTKKVLILDEKGITENFFATKLFIPWNDIEEIYIGSFLIEKVIELKIKNEEKYLNNFIWWKKKLLKLNKYMGHQTFCITLSTSGLQPEDIFPKIQELLEINKKN